MLSSNKPHCHPRLPRSNFKTILIYLNILGNNFLKQHHALTMVVRLHHKPTLKIFSTESNSMIKIVRYLPKSEAAFHSCLQPFTEKRFS